MKTSMKMHKKEAGLLKIFKKSIVHCSESNETV